MEPTRHLAAASAIGRGRNWPVRAYVGSWQLAEVGADCIEVRKGLEAAHCDAACTVPYDTPKAVIRATPIIPWQQLIRAKPRHSAFESGLWTIRCRTTASSPELTLKFNAANYHFLPNLPSRNLSLD